MSDEEWQKISQQIPDAPPVYHDLSVLDAPPCEDVDLNMRASHLRRCSETDR